MLLEHCPAFTFFGESISFFFFDSLISLFDQLWHRLQSFHSYQRNCPSGCKCDDTIWPCVSLFSNWVSGCLQGFWDVTVSRVWLWTTVPCCWRNGLGCCMWGPERPCMLCTQLTSLFCETTVWWVSLPSTLMVFHSFPLLYNSLNG